MPVDIFTENLKNHWTCNSSYYFTPFMFLNQISICNVNLLKFGIARHARCRPSKINCTPLTFGFKPRPEKGYSAN